MLRSHNSCAFTAILFHESHDGLYSRFLEFSVTWSSFCFRIGTEYYGIILKSTLKSTRIEK